MSTEAMPATSADTDRQVDKRLDLARRFTLAGFADPGVFDGIPRDVLLFLLPDDDPAFAEREVVAGAAAARRGEDVYFRHVRVADLPE
jgi:hypothetical protein